MKQDGAERSILHNPLNTQAHIHMRITQGMNTVEMHSLVLLTGSCVFIDRTVSRGFFSPHSEQIVLMFTQGQFQIHAYMLFIYHNAYLLHLLHDKLLDRALSKEELWNLCVLSSSLSTLPYMIPELS